MTAAPAPTHSDLATLAEQLFRTRQANAIEAVAQGTVDRARAEAALRPWASIALRLGADIAELAPARTGYAVWAVHPVAPIAEAEAEAMYHEAICPLDRCLATLRAARDQAIDRGDWDAAAPLIRLGETLGPLGPYRPAQQRKAA